MRSLPQNITDEITAESLIPCHLVEMYFDSTLYFTDFDLDIYHNGNWYLRRGMELDGIYTAMFSELDRTSIQMDNVEQEFSGFTGNEELRGKIIKIYYAVLNDNAQIINKTLNFYGIADNLKIDQQRARIELLNHFYLWNRKTLREHPISCPWVFKGTECGYSGAETQCEKSYDRCSELSNTDNFGGFPFMAELQNKQIWWGKTPSV